MPSPLLAQRPLPLVDVVAAKLRENLAHAKVGDKLPTEVALTQELGVSRTTIREAIMLLKSEGLLETRQGSGIFVARRVQRKPLQLEMENAPAPEATAALYELRTAIETAASALAAERRSSADLADLEAAVAAMRDPATRADADVRFHATIARATKNPHFEQFVRHIHERLAEFLASAVDNTRRHHAEAVDDVIEEHARVVRAIREGDGPGAGEAMRSHLERSADRMKSALT